jgi:hypothetical protein
MQVIERKPPTKPGYLIGLDIGKVNDHTAIVAMQRLQVETGRTREVKRAGSRVRYGDGRVLGGNEIEHVPVIENHYHVVYADRLPLGMSYPKQVEHIASIYQELKLQSSRLDMVLDMGGIGRGVIDMLRAAKLPVTGITFHAGDKVTNDGSDYRVPKRDLVTAVHLLLQTKRLRIAPELPEAETLTSELLGLKYEITPSGHDRYGNDVGSPLWRESEHDDMALALAVAVWYG